MRRKMGRTAESSNEDKHFRLIRSDLGNKLFIDIQTGMQHEWCPWGRRHVATKILHKEFSRRRLESLHSLMVKI